MVKLFLTTVKTVVQHYHKPLFMGNNIGNTVVTSSRLLGCCSSPHHSL